MTERNTSDERLSECDVESLLRQFFVHEVPAEYRQEENPVALATPQLEPLVRTTTPDSSRKLAGLLGILVSATCCLIVTMFIPGESPERDGAEPLAATNERNPQPQPETDRSLPVEERSHLPFTSTGHDPEEPEVTDPLVPELEIEIFPLRPDKPRK